LTDGARFVHHPIVQPHDKNTPVIRVHAVNRAKLVKEGAKTRAM
jgi:hypothetical protein